MVHSKRVCTFKVRAHVVRIASPSCTDLGGIDGGPRRFEVQGCQKALVNPDTLLSVVMIPKGPLSFPPDLLGELSLVRGGVRG